MTFLNSRTVRFRSSSGSCRTSDRIAVRGGPPFQGGAIGYFGYEMGGLLERLPGTAVDDLALPDMSIGFYDWVVAFDHVKWSVVAGYYQVQQGRAGPVGERPYQRGERCLNLEERIAHHCVESPVELHA